MTVATERPPCKRCGFGEGGHEPPFASSDHPYDPADRCACGVWLTGSHEAAQGAKHRAIVDAIRGDRVVGRGTCSSIDECSGDAELLETYGDCASPQDAVAKARRDERRWLERAMDAEAEWAREARDDFDARCAANPVVTP